MPNREDILSQLLAVGLVRADARQQAAEAMTALTSLLRLGKDAGLTVTEMAEAAGLPRETVYQALRNDNSQSRAKETP